MPAAEVGAALIKDAVSEQASEAGWRGRGRVRKGRITGQKEKKSLKKQSEEKKWVRGGSGRGAGECGGLEEED